MAPRITSSSNRSKRSSSKPVTKGQNPQRSNRQSASKAQVTRSGGGTRNSARVTNAGQRPNTGSARVTGTPRPALPPGRKGGPLATTPGRREQAQARQAQSAQGTRGGSRTGQPAPTRALPPGQRGGALTNSTAGRLASTRTNPLQGFGAAMAASVGSEIGSAIWKSRGKKGAARMSLMGGDAPVSRNNPRDNGRSSQRQGPPVPGRISQAPRAPQLPPPTSSVPRAAQQRTTAGGRRTYSGTVPSVVSRSTTAQAQASGTKSNTNQTGVRKWDDFNPGRGTSDTNNPLIRKDAYLMGKIKAREEAADKKAGPSSDAKEYGQYLKRRNREKKD